MFSCIGSTQPSDIQRERRTHVQIKLFEACPRSPARDRVWERLSHDERAVMIALLARLMAKTITSDSGRESDEREDHTEPSAAYGMRLSPPVHRDAG
jgi:hypothetical protein